MASGVHGDIQNNHNERATRRDFLVLATAGTATIGTALGLWPFIDSMNPAQDVLATAETEVDLSPIAAGLRITVKWRGRPVFVVHRTPEEIRRARADDHVDLIDPQRDDQRVQRPEWLVVVGVCTHLGCIPLGQKASDPRGKFGGWFCPCHGSVYDASGRVRKGPAPQNLEVPPYKFSSTDIVAIGRK